MKRLLTTLMILLSACVFSNVAHADTKGGVTCTPQTGDVYPKDGHMMVCFNATSDNVQKVFQVFEHMPSNGTSSHPGALELFKSQGVMLYYFDTRANAILYTKAKYNDPVNKTLIVPNTVKCGFTGYAYGNGVFQTIITNVFDQCAYTVAGTLTNVTNPGLPPTTAHESGHAYDYAIASYTVMGSKAKIPSLSTGITKLMQADLVNAKNNIPICSAFDGGIPSDLEIQLGAKYQKPVCYSSKVLAPYAGGGQTTLSILQEETPYFTKPATLLYEDMWAEIWATFNSGSSVLPFMDYTIGVSQLYPCTRTVLYALENYGRLPNAIGQGYPAGCPVVPDSEISTNLN